MTEILDAILNDALDGMERHGHFYAPSRGFAPSGERICAHCDTRTPWPCPDYAAWERTVNAIKLLKGTH